MILNRLFCGGANTTLPGFTYTGTYTVVDDGDAGWRIKFLTSGTLTLSSKRNIDVFCVGGGASGSYGINKNSLEVSGTSVGGAGGYTKTSKNIQVLAGKSYAITIGAGGAAVGGGTTPANCKAGGSTSAFGVTAAGGQAVLKNTQYTGGQHYYAGNGGSGGGGSGALFGGTQSGTQGFQGGKGGTDGENGYRHVLNYPGPAYVSQIVPNTEDFGQGQNASTREFGEANGTLYSGGGGGAGDRRQIEGYWFHFSPGAGGSGGGGKGADYNANAVAGTANTGGGGGGGCPNPTTSSYRHASGAGGSGIVVIRNHR